jgi:hypothetical protein
MLGRRVQPAQACEVQLAGAGSDWDRVRALVTGMADETCRVLSRRVFVNGSRKGCEQQREEADECDKASPTRSFAKSVLHVSSIIRGTRPVVSAITC